MERTQVPAYESIVCRGDTWGTETSKYPQEKKTKVIPQVVASERGGAQTVLENRERRTGMKEGYYLESVFCSLERGRGPAQ